MVACYIAIDDQTLTFKAYLKSYPLMKLLTWSHSTPSSSPQLEVEITQFPAEVKWKAFYFWNGIFLLFLERNVFQSQPAFLGETRNLGKKVIFHQGSDEFDGVHPPPSRSGALPIEIKPLPWAEIITLTPWTHQVMAYLVEAAIWWRGYGGRTTGAVSVRGKSEGRGGFSPSWIMVQTCNHNCSYPRSILSFCFKSWVPVK